MRVAVIGSDNMKIDISTYIPAEATEIISGGIHGIGSLAERWADQHKIPKLIIRSDFAQYGNAAHIHRDRLIIEMADCVIAIWNGTSTDTKDAIEYSQKIGKPIQIHTVDER